MGKEVSQLREEGLVVLRNAVSLEICDLINHDFCTFTENNPDEHEKFKLPTGNSSRLCNLHMDSEASRRAIFSSSIMDVLDEFFESRAFVSTSLYFEESSTQAIHRDTPFFNTRPRNIFAGVWIALEDVRADAGPLTYYRFGQRLEVVPQIAKNKEEVGNSWTKYCDDIKSMCVTSGLRLESALVKKGDCVIWHPELPHGGSPIATPGSTRKSMVFHCAPEDVTMYGADEFFGATPYHPIEHGFQSDDQANRKYIEHGKPFFANNY